jgi:hypothetical protein
MDVWPPDDSREVDGKPPFSPWLYSSWMSLDISMDMQRGMIR